MYTTLKSLCPVDTIEPQFISTDSSFNFEFTEVLQVMVPLAYELFTQCPALKGVQFADLEVDCVSDQFMCTLTYSGDGICGDLSDSYNGNTGAFQLIQSRWNTCVTNLITN